MKSKEEAVADAQRKKERVVNVFVNALNRFSLLNPYLNVHGANPDYRVEGNQLFSQDDPVDLNSTDLLDPRQLVEDTWEFPKDSVVLSD
ncbi:hypothetical protein RIF29_33870 [Crotalaria pallida]|uniref:Uncharacterized protein n=1 Tax=Crotalaria pallida TaxID=3830 RepID=A0AAN9E9H8_CROPI